MAKIPRRYGLLVLASVAGILVFLTILHNREPRYHGKPLSYWTTKLKQGNRQEQAEAREGIRTMGKSAVPHLLQTLQKQDGPLKIMILKRYGARFPVLYQWFPPALEQWSAYAASALGEIGPPASNAIPALLRMSSTNYNSSSNSIFYPSRSYYTAALMKIRGEPIDGLIRALDEPSSTQWFATTITLSEFGTNASPAVPALCRALNSKQGWAAAYALGYIHSHPEIAVPALMEQIKAGNFANTIWALGEFEAESSPAIPLLRQQLQNPNPRVRQDALDGLRKILSPGELKTLVPALLLDINNPDPNMQITARMLLKEIDPEAAKGVGIK